MKVHSSALRICALSAALLTAAPLLSVQTALAQSTSLTAEYVQTLQNIQNTKLKIAQTELYIAEQEAQIAMMRDEISNTPASNAEIEAMLPKAVTQVERVIKSDAPFRLEERLARLNKLKEDVNGTKVAPGEKYRRLLSLLKIEAEYGQSLDWYEDDRPLNDGEQPIMVPEFTESLDENGEILKDETGETIMEPVIDLVTGEQKMIPEQGYFVHYGRLSLEYLNLDATSARRWNAETKKWDDMSAGELIDVRRAVRMARGETARSVLTVEVKKQGGGEG